MSQIAIEDHCNVAKQQPSPRRDGDTVGIQRNQAIGRKRLESLQFRRKIAVEVDAVLALNGHEVDLVVAHQ